jgi:hypothetical protein
VRGFHSVFGVLLAVVYAALLAHPAWLPGLTTAAQSASPYSHVGTGLTVVYGLPLAAIACFLMPRRLMLWLSPRVPPLYDYLLTAGFWYLAGYLLLAVSAGLLLLFR